MNIDTAPKSEDTNTSASNLQGSDGSLAWPDASTPTSMVFGTSFDWVIPVEPKFEYSETPLSPLSVLSNEGFDSSLQRFVGEPFHTCGYENLALSHAGQYLAVT